MQRRGMVLVTGGSRGIGAATVRLAAEAGFGVVFTYVSREDAARALVADLVQRGHRAHCIEADVGEPDHIDRLMSSLPQDMGPLVGLVNNAGLTGPLGAFVDTSLETMRRVTAVNVIGTMLLSRYVVAAWLAAGTHGSIVNVSSIAATLGAPGEYVHYAATKGAVESFTIGLAKELAATGIRVNAVSPGTTLTDIHATAGEPGRPQRVASRIPMQRVARPQEIAEAIVWLLEDKASYVTGSVLKVAGGS
ncbi:SDR family oxidoreductase [Aquincola sp. MAHUQ-54]|uniref:SDR family oxidoreductase n=1 Tax=Aquincola agrisoli TaxID=3119538 RepID=A0AAW9QAK9_9BURK